MLRKCLVKNANALNLGIFRCTRLILTTHKSTRIDEVRVTLGVPKTTEVVIVSQIIFFSMLVQKCWNLERLLQENPVFVNWCISPLFCCPTASAYLGPLSRKQLHSPNNNHCVSTISNQSHWEVITRLVPKSDRTSSGAWTGNLSIFFIDWPTSAIHQMVNLIVCVTLWTILLNLISFYLWSRSKQRRWFLGYACFVCSVYHTFYILIMVENL